MDRLQSPSRQTPYSGAFVGLGDTGDSCQSSTVWENMFSQSFVKHIPECLLNSNSTGRFITTNLDTSVLAERRARTEAELQLTSVEIAPNVLSTWLVTYF